MFSIIITTHNSDKTIKKLLVSILKELKNIEIIIIDSGISEYTREISNFYGINYYYLEGERCNKRNFGVKMSNNNYVLILDSDMMVNGDLLSELFTLSNNNDIDFALIPEEPLGIGFWTECKKLERLSIKYKKEFCAARFIKKNLFDSVGGYNPLNVGSEDYDLQTKLEKKSKSVNYFFTNACLYHDEGNVRPLDLFIKKFYYSSTFIKYVKNNKNYKKIISQVNPLTRFWLIIKTGIERKISIRYIIGAIFLKILEYLASYLGILFSSLAIRVHNLVYKK
jgi:glycosyltransferase involved in cell wall biosynthesis